MRLLALALCVSIAGCVSPNLQQIIDHSNLAVTTIAQTVKDECGNTVPDGPCVSTSLIGTAEKNNIKTTLQSTGESLDLASVALVRGDNENAANRLQAAQEIIRRLQQMLEARGIE